MSALSDLFVDGQADPTDVGCAHAWALEIDAGYISVSCSTCKESFDDPDLICLDPVPITLTPVNGTTPDDYYLKAKISQSPAATP